MDRRDTSKGGAVVLVAVMATLLTGCVVNPYIRTSSAPVVGELNRDNCRNLVVTDTDRQLVVGDRAATLLYAECVRDAMAKKAGRYAWMNNGGAVVLLNMAGLAGYSGIRGGHTAQVAAMTTGGATFYGAQQYLYRKPREAIYWSGASAVGCAVGVTRRRLLVADEVKTLDALLQKTSTTSRSLEGAARDARVALQAAPPVAGCSATMQAEHTLLSSQAQHILSTTTDTALKTRQAALMRRYQTLSMADRYALVDLIAATDAIRDTVNRQLAAEQPDPSELARLLTSLKLPGLEGSAGGSGGAQEKDAPRGVMTASPPPAGGVKSAAKPRQCQRSAAQHADFKSNTTALIDQYNELGRTLDALEAGLDGIEARAGAAPDSGDALKYCTLARTNTLLPFGLQLAGNGAQTVKAGGTLSIPITGGVPPYAVRTVSGGSGLTATIKLDADGSYRIVIAAGDDAESGTFFAKDAVGAGEVVTVDVSSD